MKTHDNNRKIKNVTHKKYYLFRYCWQFNILIQEWK